MLCQHLDFQQCLRSGVGGLVLRNPLIVQEMKPSKIPLAQVRLSSLGGPAQRKAGWPHGLHLCTRRNVTYRHCTGIMMASH